MKSIIKKNSRKFLKILLTILMLALACFVLSWFFVYPLWVFAVKKPTVFTIFVFTVFALFFLYKILQKTKRYLIFENPSKEEKNIRMLFLLRSLFFWFVILFCASLAVYLLLRSYRLLALVSVVLGFICALLLYKK